MPALCAAMAAVWVADSALAMAAVGAEDSRAVVSADGPHGMACRTATCRGDAGRLSNEYVLM